jgi:pimeloyl-ACP methyl ester carboxylesterase
LNTLEAFPGSLPSSLSSATQGLLKPISWRGKTPDPADLEGSLVFDRTRRVESFDGTEIAYDVHGSDGPWVVLVPGFVCPDNFWRYLLPELERSYRVIAFDLRGLGLSGMPRPPGHRARNLSPQDFDLPNQVRDIEAILEAEGIDDATLIGHSMGGQIALEAYRLIPERVNALGLVTSPYESPMRTFYGRDFSSVFHAVRLAFSYAPRPVVFVWRLLFLINPRITHEMAKLTRALGPDAKLEDMATYYRHMAYLDPLVMLMMAESMRSHSAADILGEIRVPVLIVAGTRDMFTPTAVAEAMHESIPDSELLLVDGASHGAIIEKPDEVNAAVLSFLERARAAA